MNVLSSLNRHDAVLLDLDGTIVDSRAGIIGSLHDSLRDLGHEPDPEEDLTWVVGPPLHDLVARVLQHYGDDRAEEAVRLYRYHYERHGMHRSAVFAGMQDVIETVAASGARLFLATSKPVHLARAILDLRGLTKYFTALYGARPDDSGAEKPELIGQLLREHAIATGRAVMVGDRRYDISGAHANHVRALGALWGYGGEEELTEAGADALVADPGELLAAIRSQLAAAHLHPAAE
ncbi:Haloacid dehalogenase domain protein hydrolase [Gluconacetobacter diazotrophicus PA1 5]|uniref:HAD hydrolase-like protein n=1 Tax=Gluconacetobacter diazotrophicus TaxID=33996 RepID=A0A7W4NGH8_GLUDI|nr:HAD hydrolase-like protein [Gluconacetobacter diazotrophicus]ACI50006.1 Haloacid dehalogenase domain protein hydrolase [Gluconacetobacter diazotrophicus PA1 5]MBB2157332.1 HAD hydrolase-like protein [Gluconacetobacter diazotrophicus]TWB07914.1 phosphoglycolate phosphatase [Gluconacetobacter diazotrophicus]